MITSEKYRMGFSEESLALKYLVFAGQAEKAGYPWIALLFRATAWRETNQAHGLWGEPGHIGTAPGCCWGTGSGKRNDLQIISPETMTSAENEGHKKLPGSPRSANNREETDASPYQKALRRLAELGKGDYFVCSECGYTNEGKRQEKCPHCRSEAINLVKVG